jgi:6-phosphogluconolactonase
MTWVYANLEALSHAAAGIWVQQARQAIRTRGWFSVVLSGGHTPRRMYELLAEPPLRDRVPWTQVHVFWGDERCVPPNDSRSNEHMARQALLDLVPIPPEQVHPIRCARSAREAAEQHEAVLRTFFKDQAPRFDLVLLGLGENGHTASLFPGASVLDEQERWVAAVYVAEQNLYRVTLTAPLINQAMLVAFLVAGTAKAPVLRQVLEGPFDPHHLPAQLIRPTHGDLYWLIDQEAGSLIRRRA